VAKDIIHNAIRNALIKDRWTITRDPFTVDLFDDETFFDIDLSAERQVRPDGELESIIAIEIKSFISGSVLNAFHEALGQFLNYQAALLEREMDIDLYLAVSEVGWEKLNAIKFIQRRIQQYHLKFIVVDIQSESVEQWIK
jgi:XisH protein